MSYDISKLNKKKVDYHAIPYEEKVVYDEKLVYDESQWEVYFEEVWFLKNISTNVKYELDEKGHLLFLLQISNDTFLVLFHESSRGWPPSRLGTGNFHFYRLCIKNGEIQYKFKLEFENNLIDYRPVENYYDEINHDYTNSPRKIPYFLLSSDILVFNCHSFETYMYSISKNALINNPDINHIITPNNEISESELAKYRLISPIYVEDSAFPTYIRIDYRRKSSYQMQYIQLILEAPSLIPILLYDTLRNLYVYFDSRYSKSHHVCNYSLKEYFEKNNAYLNSIDCFIQEYLYSDRRMNDEQLLSIRPKDI